jgi:hypothetical protein
MFMWRSFPVATRWHGTWRYVRPYLIQKWNSTTIAQGNSSRNSQAARLLQQSRIVFKNLALMLSGKPTHKAACFTSADEHHPHHALAAALGASSAGLHLAQGELSAAAPCQNCVAFQIPHCAAFPAREFDALIRAEVASSKRGSPVHRLTRNLRPRGCG